MQMAREDRVPIEKLQGYSCFACGTENPIGLNLQFYRQGDAVCSDVVLGDHYQGWDHMAHGGIISTMLDEVMAWSVIYFRRVFSVTRKMELKYVRPVLTGRPITVRGRILDGSDHRQKVKAKGEIRDDAGKLLVKSSAEFVVLSEDQLSSVGEDLKAEMRQLFNRL